MQTRQCGMATASLVLALVGVILSPLLLAALIVGLVARSQISRSGGKLAGMGTANLAIGISVIAIPLHVLVAYPLMARRLEQTKRIQCLANVKNLALAINMYACEYDGFPTPADRWSESLEDYVKNADTFTCSKAPKSRSAFAYVSMLSTGGFEAVYDSGRQISIFESNAGWNAAGGKELLTPVPRHLGGDNYGFVDGHARWFARKSVDTPLDPFDAPLHWEKPTR